MSWICIQLGAREHYAIPRALQGQGKLHGLLTDAWVQPGSLLGLCHRNLRERFHPELAGAAVSAWTVGLVAFELAARAKRRGGWDLIIARNEWFQKRVVWRLGREKGTGTVCRNGPSGAAHKRCLSPFPLSSDLPILFSYSYTALGPFRFAKERGWQTVLGQIDPGPREERIVAELATRWPQYAGAWKPAPAEYWANWREECRWADVILVNSEWSRQALESEGVPSEKMVVVPLAYEGIEVRSQKSEVRGPISDLRHPISAFAPARPLRVLFLGQAIVRKGIQDLVAAARLLQVEPVRFDVVGPHGGLPPDLPGNVTFHGPVARSETARWYGQADLFVLPTHSDGFALTQLEAMAHGLPVIATPTCGEVVQPGRNGWIVPAGEPERLAAAIREAIAGPERLAEMGREAVRRTEDFSIESLCEGLSRLATGYEAAR